MTVLARGQYVIKRLAGNRNLLDWQETWKEGSLPSGWSLNGTTSENSVVLGDNPFGNKSLLWKCVPDIGGNSAGGFHTPYYTLDNEHTYRYTAFVCREKASQGGIYHGCYGVNMLSGVAEGNPYFICGYPIIAKGWYLLVGYIHPSKADAAWQLPSAGIYDMAGKKIGNGTDFKLRTPAIPVRLRNYQYNTNNPEDVAYFFNPRFEVCDGNEMSIEQLLQVSTREEIDAVKVEYKSEIQKLDNKIAFSVSEVKTYTDGKVTAEAQRATADAQAKANAAQTAATAAAAVDATTKVNTLKQETNAQLTMLSDQIASKVSTTTFNVLGNRVTAAESTITQHSNLIALKASQSDLTALGNRVSSAEVKITPDAINLTVKSQTETIAQGKADAVKEDVKSSLTLDSTGISLLGKKIALTGVVTFSALASDAQSKVNTAQSTANAAVSKADAAQGTANTANSGLNTLKSSLKDLAYQDKVSLAKLDETIIEGGYLKTNLIDANNLVVGEINSKNGNFRTLPDGTVEGVNAKFVDGQFSGVVQLSTAYSGYMTSANIFHMPPRTSELNNSLPFTRSSCGKIIKLFNSSTDPNGIYKVAVGKFDLNDGEENSGGAYDTKYIPILPQEIVEFTCFERPPVSTGKSSYQWVATNSFTLETYREANGNWYCKRSDGWMECGGSFSAGEDWVFDVNFPQPFLDTTYYVVATKRTTALKNQYLNGIMVRPSTRFAFKADIQDYAGSWNYYACGRWRSKLGLW